MILKNSFCFREKIDLGEIDIAEFRFLGPEMRFERNKKNDFGFWKINLKNQNSNLAAKMKFFHQNLIMIHY